MRKIIFLLSKILISFEFLIILISWCIYNKYIHFIDNFVRNNAINLANSGLTITISLGIFIWLLKEGSKVLGHDLKNYPDLLKWADYWKLKFLFYISVFYGVLGLIICAISYSLFQQKVGINILLILTGNLLLIISAASCYFANFQLKEILTSLEE